MQLEGHLCVCVCVFTHVHVHLFLFVYMSVCMCACVSTMLSKITEFKADITMVTCTHTIQAGLKYSIQIGLLCTATLKGINGAYQNLAQLEDDESL